MSDLIEISQSEYMQAAINSIADAYPELRQQSKTPTFALQYDGTWVTLVRNGGFKAKEAKKMVANYKERYKVSINWVQDQLRQAAEDGHITAAFGLRIRTPLLHQTVFGGKNTPYEAAAEARTAGNALGQSWCLLNCRAANEFMERVWASEYACDIRPVAQIHDAIYLLIKNDTAVLKWVNDNLIECMQWQDHDLIRHDEVKIGAELDVFYKGWHQPIKLDNGLSSDKIIEVCKRKAAEYDAVA